MRIVVLDPLTGIEDFPDGTVVDSIIRINVYNFVHYILKKLWNIVPHFSFRTINHETGAKNA